MKIAIFIKSTTFHKNHGGLETQNKTLAEGLAKAGNEVVVYSPWGDEKLTDRTENNVSYKFIHAKYKNNNVLESLLNTNIKNKFYEESYRVFLEEHIVQPFDVAFSQSTAGIGIIRKKSELKLPIISIAHGTTFSEFKTLISKAKTIKDYLFLLKDFQYVFLNYLTRQKEYILQVDKVVAVSTFVKNNVIAETHVSSKQVDVIYNGVKSFEIDLNKRHSLPVTLLYVGRVEAEKGLFELLAIFGDLLKIKSDLKLKIVGVGKDLEKLKDYAIKLGFTSNVLFLGHVPQNEIKECYESSHIFVLPTKRIEGFPVTISEAMISGLPIVAFDKGGVGEGIFDGETGYLIKAHDLKTYTQKLKELITNDSLRLKMEENAFKKGKELFSEEKMITSYLKVIHDCIKTF